MIKHYGGETERGSDRKGIVEHREQEIGEEREREGGWQVRETGKVEKERESEWARGGRRARM